MVFFSSLLNSCDSECCWWVGWGVIHSSHGSFSDVAIVRGLVYKFRHVHVGKKKSDLIL